jgi:hypothetical protein
MAWRSSLWSTQDTHQRVLHDVELRPSRYVMMSELAWWEVLARVEERLSRMLEQRRSQTLVCDVVRQRRV